jgi:phenylalanyl-tRNA synthetase alpha chain
MTTRKDWEKSWQQLSKTALSSIQKADSLETLEAVRIKIMGRNGSLTQLLKNLKDLTLDVRRKVGGPANELKEKIAQAIESRKGDLSKKEIDTGIAKTGLDLTLPGTGLPQGRLHPLTQALEEMTGILSRMGFAWAEGPHIESERYNFDALNIPAVHPARDMWDTLYLKAGADGCLLRTHTSPVQIRYMERNKPPLRIIAPGRVFRHEAADASHSAVFHQIEGLYIDKDVSMADLKGTLRLFIQSLFGSKTETRFRPSYFPFTEPSAEMDIRCLLCGGSGCAVCKRSGWLEILGSGLVHPKVLSAVGYDPNQWSGFAFGIGVERIVMLRLGINDIRSFYQNDVRFLDQFS